MADDLESSSEFSDTSSSFLDSSLESSVLESEAEDSGGEVLTANGENHPRQKLMVRVSVLPKQNR